MAERNDGVVQVERQYVPSDQVIPQEGPEAENPHTETGTDADSTNTAENKESGDETPSIAVDNHNNN